MSSYGGRVGAVDWVDKQADVRSCGEWTPVIVVCGLAGWSVSFPTRVVVVVYDIQKWLSGICCVCVP